MAVKTHDDINLLVVVIPETCLKHCAAIETPFCLYWMLHVWVRGYLDAHSNRFSFPINLNVNIQPTPVVVVHILMDCKSRH